MDISLIDAPFAGEARVCSIPFDFFRGGVGRGDKAEFVIVEPYAERLRLLRNLGDDAQPRGSAREPRGHGIHLHYRSDLSGDQVSHSLSDIVEGVDLDVADLSALLHSDRRVLVRGGRLNGDGGAL